MKSRIYKYEHFQSASGKAVLFLILSVLIASIAFYVALNGKGWVSDKFLIICLLMVFSLMLTVTSWRFLKNDFAQKVQVLIRRNHKKEDLHVILNSITEGLIAVNNSGEITYANAVAETLAGFTLKEGIYKKIEEVFFITQEGTTHTVETITNTVLASGYSTESGTFILADKETSNRRMITCSGTPIKDESGNITGVTIVFSDITEKTESEAALKNREKQFLDLIQKLPQAVYTCDDWGYIQVYNQAAADLWGRCPVPGKERWNGAYKMFDATTGVEIGIDNCPMATVFENKKPILGRQVNIERPDGTIRQTLAFPSPLFTNEGIMAGAVNMLVDITEKSEAALLVKDTEEKYKTLIENASDAIVVYSLNGEIHEFNKAAYFLTGYTYEEFKTKKLQDFLVSGTVEQKEEALTKLDRGESILFTRSLKRKDGTIIEAEVNASRKKNGYILAFIRDITERKKAEKALLESEALNRSILTAMSSHIAVVDKKGEILAVNKAWTDFSVTNGEHNLTRTGVGSNYFAITEAASIKGDETARQAMNGIKQVLAENLQLFEMEYPCHTAEKKQWFMLSVTSFIDDPTKLVVEHTDITNRITLETETRLALERYDMLAKATSDTIWDWDIKSDTIIYNNGITSMFGYQIAEVSDSNQWWKNNVHPEDQKDVVKALQNAFAAKRNTVSLAYRYRTAEGMYKHITDRAIILYAENKTPVRMIGAMQDVTHQKEEELRISKAIIETQEEERKQMGMELHDNINQVLSAALIYLSTLKHFEEPGLMFAKTLDEGKKLVLEAIIEIRRLSHQLAPASFEKISIKDVVSSLMHTINAGERFETELNITGDTEQITGEIRTNLYRILQEQINNIIKHADASRLQISIEVINELVQMTVRDNGRGFNPETVKRGIGLENIGRRVRLYNGNLRIQSAPGSGCEMQVMLPVNEAKRA